MISRPICHRKSVGGSILSISDAKAWARFATAMSAWTSILWRLDLASGLRDKATQHAGSDGAGLCLTQCLPPSSKPQSIKAVHTGKFPVVGFIKDPAGVAALYLGKQEGKDLVYMGKVGTGWSRTVSSQIRKQLDTVVSPKSKLTKPIRKPKATWVEPKFFADVEYRTSRRMDNCGPVRSKG